MQIVIRANVVIVWEITNNTFGLNLPTMKGMKPKNNIEYNTYIIGLICYYNNILGLFAIL